MKIYLLSLFIVLSLQAWSQTDQKAKSTPKVEKGEAESDIKRNGQNIDQSKKKDDHGEAVKKSATTTSSGQDKGKAVKSVANSRKRGSISRPKGAKRPTGVGKPTGVGRPTGIGR